MQDTHFTVRSFNVCDKTIPILTSDLIGTKHGFSMRAGGYSTVAHLASLNLGYDIGDDKRVVSQNRSLFFSAVLGRETDKDDVVWAQQIHSSTVQYVTASDIGRTDFYLDGFVTDQPGVPLMIKTADCCPILFHDPIAQVIGAAHGGWRGTVSGIAKETIRVMCEHGAKPEQIRCVIGPCIHLCCFEVGEDFVGTVRELLPYQMFNASIHVRENGRYHADLLAINRAFMIETGVRQEHIAFSKACTCCQPEVYFSHRATKGKRGLMGALISL